MKRLLIFLFIIMYTSVYAVKVKDLTNEGNDNDTMIIQNNDNKSNENNNNNKDNDIYNFKKRQRMIAPPISTSQYKDPRLACLLSTIIPGGGHIYLRKDLKGAMFCITTASTYAAGGYYLYTGFSSSSSETDQKNGMVYGAIATIIGAILHAVSIVEAYNDAIEINESYYLKKGYSKVYIPNVKIAKR